MEKLKDIIRNNNMSTRPEYYSGRSAIICDLNGQVSTNPLQHVFNPKIKYYELEFYFI